MDLDSLIQSINSMNNNNDENIRKESILECNAERPARLDRLLAEDSVSYETQVMNSWSLTEKSPHIEIRNKGLIGRRGRIVKSTDCVRGRVGYKDGLHVWTIEWPNQSRGTHAVVGVATDSAPLQSSGYCSLVGSNEHSWGWDLGRSKCCHNESEYLYPTWLTAGEIYEMPDELKVVLDMDEGTLGFMVDGVYLGIAFTGLKGKTIYPIISAVWGNGEIGIKYYSGLEPVPLLLQEYCRKTIRASVGKNRIKRIRTELNLPNKLKDYLLN